MNQDDQNTAVALRMNAQLAMNILDHSAVKAYSEEVNKLARTLLEESLKKLNALG